MTGTLYSTLIKYFAQLEVFPHNRNQPGLKYFHITDTNQCYSMPQRSGMIWLWSFKTLSNVLVWVKDHGWQEWRTSNYTAFQCLWESLYYSPSFESWSRPRTWRYGFSNSFSLLLCIKQKQTQKRCLTSGISWLVLLKYTRTRHHHNEALWQLKDMPCQYFKHETGYTLISSQISHPLTILTFPARSIMRQTYTAHSLVVTSFLFPDNKHSIFKNCIISSTNKALPAVL